MFRLICLHKIKEVTVMSYWLLKTEPATYSYADLERDKKAVWDGVSNPLALKNIRAMAKGDLAFVYHTGEEKAIVGIAEITSAPYPDPKQNNEQLVVIELKPKERLKSPVTLAAVKARKEFAQWELVRVPRLSVMPVSAEQWKRLLAMSK
jgi:predicted RNA-binding protein with PUA-like domain